MSARFPVCPTRRRKNKGTLFGRTEISFEGGAGERKCSVFQQIRLLTGLNMGGKTHNIAIQLVLQQCCQTNCTFLVARFSVPLFSPRRLSEY